MKRLFFSMQVVASWPKELPHGRILLESDRHLTIAFLGENHLPALLNLMSSFPKPDFRIGLAAQFDRPVFLPKNDPKTAGWHIEFLEHKDRFLHFQKHLEDWLQVNGLHTKRYRGEFFPHVTISRQPFDIHDWKNAFRPLPLYLKNIHLCESLGNSQYRVLWSHEILPPFEPIEHTADMAFKINGEKFDELFLHAVLALSFDFPLLLSFFQQVAIDTFDEMVKELNDLIARADAAQGCPFKAVSYHGECVETDGILQWEMIVDV